MKSLIIKQKQHKTGSDCPLQTCEGCILYRFICEKNNDNL